MSSNLLKRAKISVPICLVLVLIAVFSFLIMPGVSSGNGISCTVTTLPATEIGVSSAKLNGTALCYASTFSENRVYAIPEPTAGFVWGTSHGGPYPNIALAQAIGMNGFSSTITGLNPFTTYYYKAYIEEFTMLPGSHAVFASVDGFLYGNEVSFTTLGNLPPNNPLTSGDAGTAVGIPAEVNFNYINVQPTVASVNQPVTVVANVANSGTLEGGFTANLQINGQIEQTKMGTVAGNTFVPVEFTIVKDTPGTYHVDIGGQTTSFTVVAAGNTAGSNALSQSQLIFIAIGILAIAAIGLITAMILRRRSTM
jgi:hypothetical protein